MRMGGILRIETLIKEPWLGGKVGVVKLLVGVQGSHGEGRRLCPMLIKRVSIAKNVSINSRLGPEAFHPDHRYH